MQKEQTFVLIHVNGGLDNMGDRFLGFHLNSGRFCISEMSLYCVLYYEVDDNSFFKIDGSRYLARLTFRHFLKIAIKFISNNIKF
ncbi:hypothetical protein RIR_jg27588.t1 [Rhizophagus irregularis DAOM 181602=DAOM 197198]|nr:hypothetical protein RIR_jg27588.t1 [Rhizophagus irregularis DAOM 181602=DAOM 197198]